MKINFVPIICIIFLTMFLLVVIPTTKTFRGDIDEIMDSPAIDSITSVKINNTTTKTITTIQH